MHIFLFIYNFIIVFYKSTRGSIHVSLSPFFQTLPRKLFPLPHFPIPLQLLDSPPPNRIPLSYLLNFPRLYFASQHHSTLSGPSQCPDCSINCI